MELQKMRRKVFAGGLWDKDTKLIRFGVRDYDPEVGRWTSKEPLGFKGSRNFYVYAGNDGVVTEEYSYDANGNRLTADFDYAQSPIIASYDAQDRMLTYGENVYTYTLNGSLLTKTNAEGTTTYSYDAMGNLLKVVLPDTRVISYKIDARGRRIGKSIDGVFQYGFIYGDQLNPIAKVDENGDILEKYVYGLRSNVPEYIEKDGVKYKIISDHLGSPVKIVKYFYGLEVKKEIKYDTFGQILSDSNPNFDFPFRFAGGLWDEDTKLIRFGVRDYDPEVGRWTSKEPLGFKGSRNFYVYAGNDGVNFVDLNGLYKGWFDKNNYHNSNNLSAIDKFVTTLR